MNNNLVNHFDRKKPFYPYVVAYALQLQGLREMVVRGYLGERKVNNIELVKSAPNSTQDEINEHSDFIKKLLGPLKLRSAFQDNDIVIDGNDIAKEVLTHPSYLLPHFLRAATSLLVLAHEVTKDKEYRNHDPLWEFLRHCRNAATHNGAFHFTKAEPRFTAEWGDFIISANLQGKPLFQNKEKTKGFLSLGDPIRLLWDIEKAYPQISI